MHYHISDRNFAKYIFDDLVDSRYSSDFSDMSTEEKHALRNWFLECAPHVLNDIKNDIVARRKLIRSGNTCVVYYHAPHQDGHADLMRDWQAALEKVVEIYHTTPNANIEIYDGKNDKRYTCNQLAAIIKDYYVVTRKTGDRDFEISNSYLTIEGQAINAFNTWMHIDGEFKVRICDGIFDETDSVTVKGEKHGYTYIISKHKMEVA
jgi:hypothetical protein